ncbi:MAG TPA: hypothetical protein EYH22_01030 [Candidatus Nanopusillus sp.]|nr:hypothetical protein [Candidatus Nanopusillus sp.]
MLEVITHKEIEIYKPILIYGVGGGMGNVAKLVGRKIIKTFKAKLYSTYLIDAFPDIVYSDKKGVLRVLKLDLYYFNFKNRDFLVLYGDVQPNAQPLDVPARFTFSRAFLKFLKENNSKLIISVGGYGIEIEPEDPKLYFAANNKKVLRRLKKILKEDFNLYTENNIVGLSGLLVSLARFYKIPAFITLAETYPTININGYLGAKKIIESLNKLFGFNIELKDYEEKGKKVRESILKHIKYAKGRKPPEKRKDIYYFG